LIVPCEVAVKSVVPAIKALLAQELHQNHNLRQEEIAEILGISQSAVSRYTHGLRGQAIRIDEIEAIHPLILNMVNLLQSQQFQRDEFMQFFCQTCMIVRRSSLMCKLCQRSDPKIKIEECSFCNNPQLRP